MRKLGAIIDFNNIAMRSMFTCQYMGDGTIQNFDTEEECGILVRKIVSDLTLVLRTFSPDRVIIACDAKDPWRNSLYDEIEGMTYKGNREKDENKNWTNIFSSFDELKEILKVNGMVVTELDNTEADDLAALWKDSLFDDGFNVIMVSSDKDWSQLVSFGEGKDGDGNQFCISYNPIANKQIRKIYVTEGFMNWYNTNDVSDIFFSNYDEAKNKMRDIINVNQKIVFEVIDPERILLDKIMCGDDGDNIPAFYDYYKNGRKVRVTPLKASHIYDSLGIDTVSKLCESADEGYLKDAMEKEMKKEMDVDFVRRLTRQRKLVELSREFFPDDVCMRFDLHAKKMKGEGFVISSSMKMDTVLKGSRFFSEKYNQPRENSIFDDLESLSKYSKTPSLF